MRCDVSANVGAGFGEEGVRLKEGMWKLWVKVESVMPPLGSTIVVWEKLIFLNIM